jgi:hypothetical protein
MRSNLWETEAVLPLKHNAFPRKKHADRKPSLKCHCPTLLPSQSFSISINPFKMQEQY